MNIIPVNTNLDNINLVQANNNIIRTSCFVYIGLAYFNGVGSMGEALNFIGYHQQKKGETKKNTQLAHMHI